VNGGLIASFVLHGFLLAWALISFEATAPLKTPELVPVEVAIISPDDLIRLKQGDRSSKNLETEAAKNQTKPKPKIAKVVPRVVAAPPPPAEPPPIDVKPKKVEPAPDEVAKKIAALEASRAETEARLKAEAEKALAEKQKAADDARLKAEAEAEAAAKSKAEAAAKAKAEAEAEAKKAKAEKRRKERQQKLAEKRRREKERKLAEAKRREDEKKRQFDPNKISALLNKIPDAGAPDSGSKAPDTKKPLPKGPAAGAPEGRDTRLTASQRSLLGVMMKDKVRNCWRVQTGMAGADRLVVDVEVKLNLDGRLAGPPRVTNRHTGGLFADAANNAIRALEQCAPYDLPKELYKGGWDHMVVTFDPQKMF